LVPATIAVAQDGPCDVNDSDSDCGFPLPDDDYRIFGQTFTTHWEYELYQVDIDMEAASGDSGEFTPSIRNYDEEAGEPGSELGSTTELIQYEPEYDGWSSFTFSPQITLQACQKYVMLLIVISLDGNVYLHQTCNNQYTEGERILSTDYGSSWMSLEDEDFRFRLYGCSGDRDSCGEPSTEPEPSPAPTPTQPSKTVGGNVFSVNKIGLIAPWVALGVIIIVGGILLYRRRVHSIK